MTKKLQITLLSVLAALLCVALVFGGVSLAPKAQAAKVSEDGTTVTFDSADDFIGGNNITGLSSSAKEKLTSSVTKVIINISGSNITGVSGLSSEAFANTNNAEVEINISGAPNLVNFNVKGADLHKMNVVKITASGTFQNWVKTSSDGKAIYNTSGSNALIWAYDGNSIPTNLGSLSISSGALYGVTEINIPANVSGISADYKTKRIDAFNPDKVTKITVASGNSTYASAAGHDCVLYTKAAYSPFSANTLIMSKDGYIPDPVTKIAAGALRGAENVTITAGITDIANGAFDSSIKSISVAEGNTSFKVVDINGQTPANADDGQYLVCDLGEEYGMDLYASTDGRVPEGVQYIYMDSLKGYSNISLSSTVSIIDGTFDSALETVTVASGNEKFVTANENKSLIAIDNEQKSLVWTKTGTVPESVTKIDKDVLKGFTAVSIPASVTSINANAFDSALQSITVDPANTVFSDGGNHNMLVNKQSGAIVKLTPSVVVNGKITIPDTVKSIGANMFSGFGATEIVIPNSVESIAAQAFAGCKGLQKLSIPFPGQTKTTGRFASLFDSNIPSGQDEYYAYVRDGAIPLSLTEVHITGSGVTLASGAFNSENVWSNYSKTNIETITLPDDVTLGGSNVFPVAGTDNNGLAKFLKENKDGYIYLGNESNPNVVLISGNKTDLSVQIPENTVAVNSLAFKGAAAIEVVLPSTLKQICDDAFVNCVNLTNVYNLSKLDVQKGATTHGKVALYATELSNEFTESSIVTEGDYIFVNNTVPVLYAYNGTGGVITLPADFDGKRYTIANGAFKDNATITDVVIPALSALNIGNNAFENCTNLKSLVMNDLENSIGNAAFKGCTSLTSVTFYNCHITEIADQAFMSCSSLLEVALPDSVTRIGDSAFDGCSSAVAISLGNHVEYIGILAFANTTSLKAAYIPDSVTELGDTRGTSYKGVFFQSGIESAYIGNGITKLPTATFGACRNLTTVTFAEDSKLENIELAFEDCSAVTSIKLPASVTHAYRAFKGMTSLTSLYIPAEMVNLLTVGETVKLSDKANQILAVFNNTKLDHALTVYLPDLQGETAEEKAAFAKKLAVIGLYLDQLNISSYYSWGNERYNDITKETVFGNMMFVLPNKETYDAVVGVYTEDFYKSITIVNAGNRQEEHISERNEWKWNSSTSKYEGTPLQKPGMASASDFSKHFYYVADVTYELYKQMSDGSTKLIDSETVKKLANNEGADIRYVLMTDKYGSKYYAIDESYAMPTIIGATTATGEWKVGNIDGEAFVLDGAKINGANKFVNVLGADAKLEITVEDEYTSTYNGEEWTLPASLADKATITSVNGVAGAAITNAGTYTVVITAGADYQFADGSNTATVTVVINKAQAQVVWTYNGEVLDEDEVVTKTFDGKTVASALTLTYVGVNGETLTISNDLITRMLNGESTMANAMGAGLWTLNLSELVLNAQIPNYAFTHTSHQFRINNVQLSSNDVLDGTTIDLEGTATLNDGMLYIYEDNSHSIIPSRTPLTGYTLKEVINVERSIIRYTNRDWTLNAVVLSGSADKLALNADATENNVQKAIGRQTTTFVFNAKDNYEFALSINGGVAERGLTFTVSEDGKTLTVTKTWYVVQLANELVKASYTGTDEPADADLYTVANWTYGQNVSFTLPRLWHGDEADTWATDDSHVKFTLTMQGVADAIVANANRSVLLNYLNKYMPAGHYTLTVTVSAFDTETASYPKFSRIYEFTVAKANITIDESKLPKNDNTGYANYAWELTDNANKELFFKDFADKITANGVLNTVNMDAPANTYWGTTAGKAYFGDYEVKYNFARMNNEIYVLSNNNDILTLIDGGARGTYTVYFQVEMKNHENLTNVGTDGRYAYFFTVTVWEKVATPVVSSDGLVYTGNKVQPEIAENELYEVIWDADDAYVAGGKHSVSFRLYDSVHYRWKDISLDTVSVDFTIGKANNAWVRVPNIVNWTYDTFDTQINRIRAVVKFLDEGQSIKFSVVKSDNSAIADLTDFEVKADGTVDNQTLIAALNGLKVGAYKLKVTVASTDNYGALEQYVDFTIGKSINTWADGEDDLVLPSWIVGTFNPEENLIVVKAAHGEAVIEIRDMDGNVYYNSTKPEENTLNTLDVGKYLLVAWVDESEDYAALAERSFTIEVLEKIGLPWWGTTLIAVGSLAVAAAIILILWKLKVFEILTDKISLAITTRATVDATIAAVRATKKAEEADAHKRKVEARERLEAAREANKNKTPEQRAEELAAKAEVTATKADKLQKRADKMKARADKLAGKTEQNSDVTENPDEAVDNPDDTSTEE